jgi:hypothetical protein
MNLPSLVLYSDHSNNWDVYLEVIYDHFKIDFVDSKPVYEGIRLGLKKHPQTDGKEATFWHLVTKGLIEANRKPEIPRCERIRWPRPLIENSKHPTVRVWENTRKTKSGIQQRICICYGNWEYLVVLTKRKNFILPWTAYPIGYNSDKRKLEKDYNAFHKITQITSSIV